MFTFLIPILQQHVGVMVGVVFTALSAAIARLIEKGKIERAHEDEMAKLKASR